MHTGINTGLVVARRSDARAGDYALTGDTVNTAARLRSLAAPGEVVVSATTWQQVSDFFDAEAAAPVAVKGKEQPLVAYRILGARQAPAGGRRPLVGRDEELRDFRALAEACARAQAQPRRRRSRRPRRRQVAPGRRVRRDRPRRSASRATARAVLDFGAETGRDAVRSLARSLLGVDGDRRRSGATRRRSSVRAARGRLPPSSSFPARPARRRAAARPARARRRDEHGGARAGLAARLVRHGVAAVGAARRCSSSSRTSTGPTRGRSSGSPRSPCWPRASRCCW